MTYTDLPCRTCKAPVGKHCTTRNSARAVDALLTYAADPAEH